MEEVIHLWYHQGGEEEWKIEWSSTRNTVGWIDATAVEVEISKVRFFSKTWFHVS